jgi:2-amino-4-hydroxy-6-hydroxymethyldihydropteridine diphosphokinase
MPLIVISLGSNLGNKLENLQKALTHLSIYFDIKKTSQIIETEPVECIDQPKFLNQLALAENCQYSPYQVLTIFNSIERSLGRVRLIEKGPRTIDLDIISIETLKFQDEYLVLDHPALYSRSYLKQLMMELL